MHFACHAYSDLLDPSASGIELADGVLTVAGLSTVDIGAAEFAALNACETARGGIRLADEGMHVASALQLAGYRHVLGTLWPVPDQVAAVATRTVYEAMAAGTGAPYAIHAATRMLRTRYPTAPTRWAAHVHLGG